MYFFGTLNRREKRLIVILTTANLLIMSLFYAGTRSFREQTRLSNTEATYAVSDSGTAEPSVSIHKLPGN